MSMHPARTCGSASLLAILFLLAACLCTGPHTSSSTVHSILFVLFFGCKMASLADGEDAFFLALVTK